MIIFDKVIANRIAYETNSGYWKVGNRYFFNKADCLRYATSMKDYNVTFHFFDELYTSLNWTKEPTESIDQLYGMRAKQLRDNYDYVMLAFTGGSDSRNMIDAFLDNNIHIDEIVTLYPTSVIEKMIHTFDRTDKSATNLMYEYTEAALPKLREVAVRSPTTIISVIDYAHDSIDIISSGNQAKLILAGTGGSPSLTGHYLLGEKMRSYASKGRVTCVAGIDKPRLMYNNLTKEYSIHFIDISVAWGKHNDMAYNGYIPNIEFFYYAKDFPELFQKQCHVIKRFMDPIVKTEVRPKYYDKMHKNYGRYDIFQMETDFVKKILYKGWDSSLFQAAKPTGYFYQESADWFYKTDITNKRTKDYHNGQIREMIDGVDTRFIVFDNTGRPLKFIDTYTTPILI